MNKGLNSFLYATHKQVGECSNNILPYSLQIYRLLEHKHFFIVMSIAVPYSLYALQCIGNINILLFVVNLYK